MPIEIVVTSGRLTADPYSRGLIDYVKQHQAALSLSDAVLYYDFPSYIDYETAAHRPDILIFSPEHGFVAIRFWSESLFVRSKETIADVDRSLGDFCSNLYSRLLRSRELRKSQTQVKVDVHPVIFIETSPGKSFSPAGEDLESDTCGSLEAFAGLLKKYSVAPISSPLASEVRSILEGAKALAGQQKRVVVDPNKQPLAAALATLEAEISNFDQKQRYIALVEVGGPARIRGLAGSGKTVILAMKAAHIHLNNPDHKILFTFFTKSLRATIKTLVTKFYRHFSENDPDWTKIHIRHGWGGATIPGVYSDACKRHGRSPLKLEEARRLARGGDAFGAACADLLSNVDVAPYYDHVLIDEGQDFPSSFYELCYALATGERDRKSIVWAYDELQNILNIQIRTPEELFGKDKDGLPRVSLDRSAKNLPPGATNDAVLSKCYRNQRDVLVTAHAMGFGVYGQIVQLLESAEHWRDVGYEILDGSLATGTEVRVIRPPENSPIDLKQVEGFPLIDWKLHEDLDREVAWIVRGIQSFVSGGLAPEELLVVALDDRAARTYLKQISEQLAAVGIASNNIIADPYNEPPFSLQGKVTLTTVYRAKGNEAAVVFAAGIDAVDLKTRAGRNKIFTAFTRSKAWLRVSGITSGADTIVELKKAVELSPEMRFIMPDLRKIETIQRDFSKKQAKAKAAREEFIRKLRAAGYSDDEIEEELSIGIVSE